MFPLLKLLRKIGTSGWGARPYYLVTSRPAALTDAERPPSQTIDLAFVFPGGPNDTCTGNLGEGERSFLVQQISQVLEKEFAYRTVKVELRPEPSFWYPFLADRILCCRLAVTRGS
ncbi:MAG: hypothetical protein ACE5MH_01025 [Terriglobia bacterium]